jgi:tetratricopeptide (TPR) repeat protein
MKREEPKLNARCLALIDRLSNICASFRHCVLAWICRLFLVFTSICPTASGATNNPSHTEIPSSPPAASENARELYNTGTKMLRAGKWNDAEMFLESSLATQDERIQPTALFNLGYVRFAQGSEELKKAPPAGVTSQRARDAAAAGDSAIQQATGALASNDLQQMIQAYIIGRGARKEMSAATKAVQSAMKAYGQTLSKWRRALSDFQSAAELNPADTNATHNAEVVAQEIAKLVDRMREMQMAAAGLGAKQDQLKALLKQLKGQIPAQNAPPGASGEGEEDEDGNGPSPESLAGQKESAGERGPDDGLSISPEAAEQIMNGIQPDGKQLPMGPGDAGKPKDRSGRIW